MKKNKNKHSNKKSQQGTVGELEKIYLQFMIPMPHNQWDSIKNLSQPSVLKRVPSRTAYSSVGD